MIRPAALLTSLAAAFILAAVDLAAQCPCGPVYQAAPSSTTYRFETVNQVPLSGLQAATEYGAGQWVSKFGSHGRDITMTQGAGGLRIIVTPDIQGYNAVASRDQGIIWVGQDNITDPNLPADWLRGLMLHELGHIQGLGQAPNGCEGQSVMANETPSSYRTTFTNCDNQSFDAFYPPDPSMCATDPAWPGCNSPLLIDTKGNGFKLTSAAKGVMFDIDADGDLDQVGWTAAGSDDAWLAMDRNGNGTIDNGRELFGDVTPAFLDRAGTTANGFEALKSLEAPCYGFSVANGVIDANDEAFGKLLLWYDLNHNGISEPQELTPVAASPLSAIDTAYRTVERDRHGNAIRQISTVRWNDAIRDIVDVWVAGIEP